MSSNCFWDRDWGHAVQLLTNFFAVLNSNPEVFAKPSFFLFFLSGKLRPYTLST